MKSIALIILLLAFFSIAGCSGQRYMEFVEFPPSTAPEAACDYDRLDVAPLVSLVAVLADPTEFDGSRVSVMGVLNLQFEGNQLCLDRDSLQYFVTKNCIAIALAPDTLAGSYDEIAIWNGHYALLEGEVSSENRGHFGMFRASLLDVSRVMVVKSPRLDK